jgi:hypothetical protein
VTKPDPTSASLRAALGASRNPDGGWPYYAGKTSRLEPTAWALLALNAAGERVSLDPFAKWPRRDGWFLDRASDEVNVGFNGLAGLTLGCLSAPASMTRPLVDALVASKGRTYQQVGTFRQNNSLQGWSWVANTFSWIEPTAWAMLCLKRAAVKHEAGVKARLEEAERIFEDRVCKGGGWNFGNSNVLGQDLPPYVPTTALSLLALGDRREAPYVTASVDYLARNRLTERSAMALGLTAIALGVYNRRANDVADALRDIWVRTSYLGNLHATAVAMYALNESPDAFEAFRVI